MPLTAFRCRDSSQRKHGEAFPLPTHAAVVANAGGSSPRSSSSLHSRVAETLGVLNELEAYVAARGFTPKANSSGPPSTSQRIVLQHVSRTIANFGEDDSGRSDYQALCDLLQARDYYAVGDSHARVPFCRYKLKFLQKKLRPLDLLPRLSGEARRLRTNYRTCIERSELELQRMVESGSLPQVRPYWDPILQSCRTTRVAFLRELVSIGLGGYSGQSRAKLVSSLWQRRGLKVGSAWWLTAAWQMHSIVAHPVHDWEHQMHCRGSDPLLCFVVSLRSSRFQFGSC